MNINEYQNVFWELGENWWKQIIDGRVHAEGPLVFDNGYGSFRDGIWGHAEPGFLEGVKNASHYASENLGEPLIQELYQEIHRIACAHFDKIDRRFVNMDFEMRGKYRRDNCRCLRKITKYYYRKDDEKLRKIIKRAFFLQYCIESRLTRDFGIPTPSMDRTFFKELSTDIKASLFEKLSTNDYFTSILDLEEHINNGNPFFHEIIETNHFINQQMNKDLERYNIEKLFACASFQPDYKEPAILIKYNYLSAEKIEQAVEKIFTYYNKKIASLPLDPAERTEKENNKALKEIARLYQSIEWLHPFQDGQGRTDLILLTKLLVENGFNPAILYEPYFSTFQPLDKWVEYLKEGMQQWRRERQINALDCVQNEEFTEQNS